MKPGTPGVESKSAPEKAGKIAAPTTDRRPRYRSARPTIGYLAPRIGDNVSQALWLGVVDAARAGEANLICFAGEVLADAAGCPSPANAAYRLVNPAIVDGLVTWASSIGGSLGHEEIARFHLRCWYPPWGTRLSMVSSCGNVQPIIPDLIEIGVEILNPVHVRARGMEPSALKRDFGDVLVFWGGGVDTQGVLPAGPPQEVKDDVRRNVEALARGGGYVFSPVHNIQADVPPENMLAMLEGFQAYGVYGS